MDIDAMEQRLRTEAIALGLFPAGWRVVECGTDTPLAMVNFSAEPCPETGTEGWGWWACGKFGESSSFQAAMDAALAIVRSKQGIEQEPSARRM